MKKITFKVDGEEISLDGEALTATSDNFQEELFKTPQDYLRVGSYLAKVNLMKNDSKLRYEAERGRMYNEYKSGSYEALYFKKPTEEGLTQALNEIDSLNDIRKEINKLSSLSDELYNLRCSIQMKYDSVCEVCKHIRYTKASIQQEENQ